MKRYNLLLLALALTLSLPALGLAGLQLRPGAQLEVYAAKGEMKKAEALASTHTFDSATLGRALWRALMRAPVGKMGERIDVVQMLLAAGADPNWTDRAGITPLMLAAQSHHAPTVKALLKAGADPQKKDNRGRTASHHAEGLTGDASKVIALLGAPPKTVAQPEVQNLAMTMDGSDIIVTYDLSAPQPACVRFIGSIDGGATYEMKIVHVIGDLGEDIPPGVDKKIVWKSGEDYPDGLDQYDALIDVVTSYCN